MKFFFLFFLFCMPFVSALAVTPTSITLSEENGAQVYVYNTQEQSIDFRVHGIYAENFTLAPYEIKTVSVPAQTGSPFAQGSLTIEEVYPEGFVNAISIPVSYAHTAFPQHTKKYFSQLLLGFSLLLGGIIVFVCIYSLGKKGRDKCYYLYKSGLETFEKFSKRLK